MHPLSIVSGQNAPPFYRVGTKCTPFMAGTKKGARGPLPLVCLWITYPPGSSGTAKSPVSHIVKKAFFRSLWCDLGFPGASGARSASSYSCAHFAGSGAILGISGRYAPRTHLIPKPNPARSFALPVQIGAQDPRARLGRTFHLQGAPRRNGIYELQKGGVKSDPLLGQK